MTRENAKKLQSMMAKEAVTLLMLGGAEADTAEHEEAIRLIGEAWGLAEEETARQIERIGHGRQSVRMGAENMPPDEGDVPLVLTGREVIELERELFETAVRLNDCALPGFVDSKNEEKTERNAGYLVVSHSGGGMLRQGTRKGIRRTPANRGMRAHRIVKGLDISEDVCHGMCP